MFIKRDIQTQIEANLFQGETVRILKAWKTNYPRATYIQIHRDNYRDFVVV